MPHDRPADCAWEGIRDLTNTHRCRLGQVFHTRDQVGWGCWTPERFSPCLCSLHACFDALGDERGCSLGHDPNDRQHRLAHRTLRGHVILHTDAAHPEVMELLQRFEEIGNTASKPVELPDKHTVTLMMACRAPQRLELGSAFLATGEGNIKGRCHNRQPGTYGVTSET